VKVKNGIYAFILILILPLITWADHGEPSPEQIQFYRDLTLKIRPAATFKVPMPTGDMSFNYEMELAQPIYPQPLISDMHWGDPKEKHFSRNFFDRIWTKENSFLQIGADKLPITCVFVNGQDNRFSGTAPTPTRPQLIMRIYLVVNDYTCVGPLNPGFPQNGGKPQTWDTYVYYEVKDPTIMLPVEAHLRYRWNEFPSTLVQ
jgi:hypothetical protein